MSTGKVTGLYIYPVKSCRGISLTELQIGARGPLHDREWMLVDENNQFMTLRTFAKMAEIKTSVQGSFLHLYAGTNKILVNFTEECEVVEDVTIWGETFKAGIENKSINEALSDYLSKSVKLVRYQSQSFRDLEESATSVVKETTFTDSKPVLFANMASLADLNSKLIAKGEAPSVIERFRANIIVEGFSAYEEEEASEIKVGSVVLANPKLCGRCPVITQDIETGLVVSKATLQTLAEDRRKPGSSKIAFGVYLTPASTGVIRIGDFVSL
ncbi:MAG: MOSC N-terminal beta barrel domain-containing protein [Pseudobdellovibrio sp.]